MVINVFGLKMSCLERVSMGCVLWEEGWGIDRWIEGLSEVKWEKEDEGLELKTRKGIWDSGLKEERMDGREEVVKRRDGKQDSSKDTCGVM